jgi:histidinol dehydrogenase
MKINVYHWAQMDEPARRALCRRAEAGLEAVLPGVEAIIAAVRAEGDAAVRRFTRQFDGAALEGMELAVSEEEMEAASARVPPEVREAIAYAVENVRRFHRTQLPPPLALHEVRPGVYAGDRWTPIDSVGLYAPRGRGSFPSVTYMLAVPAALAGVPRVALATPPDREGRPDPATLHAARLCGLHEVYRVGGVQAVAALACGTQSIPRVDKILGPGSVYVAAAKRALAAETDVGLPAGPSESVVLADGGADARRVALDLMVEAEHGGDSSCFLATPSEELAAAVSDLLPALLSELAERDPQRAAYVGQVLGGFGGIVLAPSLGEALEFVNAYAPEHLQVACAQPFAVLAGVRNAGEILLGQAATFSLANYAVGCNNVLPTGGRARSASALSVRDFMKVSSVLHLTAPGAAELAGPVTALADYEGFPAHARAVRHRAAQSPDAAAQSPSAPDGRAPSGQG